MARIGDRAAGSPPPRVFLTLKLPAAQADFEQVLENLALSHAEVDTHFGLRSISPDQNLYSLLVEPRAAARVRQSPSVERISGNPMVESAEGDPTA